jgi:Type II secretory pathway, prepilin signal peptidase PulO and related peptidases
MICIVLGGLGFLSVQLLDIVSLKRIPGLKPLTMLVGNGLLVFSIIMLCLSPDKLALPLWSGWLGWALFIGRAAAGGGIGLGIFLLIVIVSRGGMGWGDVKLAALIGLVFGFPLVFVALLIGVVLGGVVAALLLLLRIKKRKEAIPFGPFLALAAIVTLLWGSNILSWYRGLF